jgi:hypothetical protein
MTHELDPNVVELPNVIRMKSEGHELPGCINCKHQVRSIHKFVGMAHPVRVLGCCAPKPKLGYVMVDCCPSCLDAEDGAMANYVAQIWCSHCITFFWVRAGDDGSLPAIDCPMCGNPLIRNGSVVMDGAIICDLKKNEFPDSVPS